MKRHRTKHRNSVFRAIVEAGLVAKLAGQKFRPKKGRGAGYDRRGNKLIEDE